MGRSRATRRGERDLGRVRKRDDSERGMVRYEWRNATEIWGDNRRGRAQYRDDGVRTRVQRVRKILTRDISRLCQRQSGGVTEVIRSTIAG